MKPVSPAYKEQINKPLRNPSLVKIIFQQIAVGAHADGVFTDNGHEEFSSWEHMGTNYAPAETYTTLEQNRWVLGGQTSFLPEHPPYRSEGFVADVMSDANALFLLNPMITRTFHSPYNLTGLTFTFDGVNNDYPEHIIIRYYNGNIEIDSLDIDNISSSYIVIEHVVEGVERFTVEFVKTCVPYRRVRIQRMLFGVEKTFSNTQVESVEQITDVDPINRRLPTETVEFTIFDFEKDYDPDNPQGVWEYIDTQSPIIVQYGYTLDNGLIEWVDADRYMLDGRPTVENNRATFKATKLIGYMTDRYYKGTTGTKTLYALAEAVLLDADLPSAGDIELPWHIDPSLSDISTTAALPIDTHKNLLQLIAHAGMCRFYTDAQGVIRIEPFDILKDPEDFTIDFNSVWEYPKVSKIEPLHSINVLMYSDSISASATELHKSTFEVSGSMSFYVEYNAAQDVVVGISGGALSDVRTYAQAVEATITATGTVTVTITGKVITTTASGNALIVGNDGEAEIVENPLVTSPAHKQMLEQHLAAYLNLRNTYETPYRGNPELDAGDIVYLQSPFTTSFPVIVLKHVISYNGALRGDAIFKRVEDNKMGLTDPGGD